jgi:rare lipoprotein A
MKSLIAALAIGLFFPLFCFGQSQTGNASYNASKSGYHISHASLSFGTRVRVTNLNNNRQVIATVNGRIPASDPRIADISRDAGDAVGMAASGYTELRIEQLPPEQEAAPEPAAVQPPAPVQPPASVQPPAPAPAPAPAPVENIQIISPPPVQYVLTERPAQPARDCADSPLCVAILILLIIAVLLLAVILALILRHPRLPLWAWFYPSWVRRRLYYRKPHRR